MKSKRERVILAVDKIEYFFHNFSHDDERPFGNLHTTFRNVLCYSIALPSLLQNKKINFSQDIISYEHHITSASVF